MPKTEPKNDRQAVAGSPTAEKRYANVTLVIGKRKTGKTTYILDLIEAVRHDKGVLIYDLNNEPKYKVFPQMPLERLPAWKSKGVYRIFHDDFRQVMQTVLEYNRNAFLILEDATAYIESNVDSLTRRFLVSCRHINIDLVLTFHSLSQVPPRCFAMTDYMVVGKSNDTLLRGEIAKVPNFQEVKKAWERVRSHPSPYHREVVDVNG